MYFCYENLCCWCMRRRIISIWRFYVDGFRSMTWGRQLWWLILLKVIILFAILRAFFFEPVLSGKSEEQKIEHVGSQLIEKQNHINN